MKIKTYHVIKGKWSYTQYKFSPTVLLAERRILWYDEDRLTDIKQELKHKGVIFWWNVASENTYGYTKHSTRIEIYKKYPEDTPFEDKIADMENMVDKYQFQNARICP